MQSISEVLKNIKIDSDFNPIRDVVDLKENRYCCLRCGETVRNFKIRMPDTTEYRNITADCSCHLLNVIKEKNRRVKIRNVSAVFESNSLINKSLINATFQNFEVNEYKQAYEQACEYVKTFDVKNPKNLLFQGSFGTGKSHLSVSITKELTKQGFTTIFVSIPQLLTKIRNTYNKDVEGSETELIKALSTADLVVFDDIGAEGQVSEWGMQKLFEVIDARLGKHNIYTTNLDSKEMNETRDLQRIFSRIGMNAELVKMDGTDYRLKNFVKGDA